MQTITVPPITPTIRLRRLARRWFFIALRIYLIVCALLYLGQDWIAFPGARDQGTLQTRIRYGGDAPVLHLTTSTGIPVAAVFGHSPIPHSPTVLYLYGNGGCVAYSEGEFNHLREIGCNVLIPDLPGYGESGGVMRFHCSMGNGSRKSIKNSTASTNGWPSNRPTAKNSSATKSG